MKGWFIFLFPFFSFAIQAQNGLPPTGGSRSAGMGYTGITYNNIHSAFTNQAGLAKVSGFAAFASGEQRFLLSELQSLSAALAYGTKSGTFGLTISHFGFEGYNEQRFGLAYGRKLFDKLAIGGQMLLFNTSIPEYGSRTAVTFELGILSSLSRRVDIAFHIFNPIRIDWVEKEKIPTLLRVGMAYHPSDILNILVEIEKDIDQDARGKVGVEYQVADQVDLRLGVATGPTTMTLGVGYQIMDKLVLNIASSYHQVLGFSPAAGIVFEPRKKKEK